MKAHSIWLFTNRNCMIFNDRGEQMGEAQAAITCYSIDAPEALRLTREAQEFHFGKWKQWMHPISREDMQYLLGLRTREMDLADLAAQAAQAS